MTEDEMVGQCHRSNQHEFDPTPGGRGRQEGLACPGLRGHEESDTTKRLNNNNHLVHFSSGNQVLWPDLAYSTYNLIQTKDKILVSSL